MSQLFIILSIPILCASAFSITILCARAFHLPIVVIRPLVDDLWYTSESDESESDAALLKRLKRKVQTERARVECAEKRAAKTQNFKESDEDEKESGDSETILPSHSFYPVQQLCHFCCIMQHPGHMPAETIQRMMTLLLSSIESPGKKKGLWRFQNPDSVIKAAWVYGQSAHAHQELPVDVGEIPDSRWYPCLVAYNNEDPGYQNVLCKPLENGCKRQFRTHESRLVYINSHAPQPQHFDHSTVTIKDIIEPQPEHFERSTGHCRRCLEEL